MFLIPHIACRECFTLFMFASHKPPAWLACGALKRHSIPQQRSLSYIGECLKSWKAICISLLAATKFVPLSDHNVLRFPQRLINRERVLRKASLWSDGHTSRYVAFVLKHTNMTPQRLHVLRPWVTVLGPNKSTPAVSNGSPVNLVLSCGNCPINCCEGLACIFLQIKQLLITSRTFRLVCSIQKRCLDMLIVVSIPE